MPKQPVTSEHPTETSPPAVLASEDGTPQGHGPGTHPSGLAIIASKIAPALRGRPVLARPRLAEWFERHSMARLMLVSAEAGYGKSTLLTEHALSGTATCTWYRIEGVVVRAV